MSVSDERPVLAPPHRRILHDAVSQVAAIQLHAEMALDAEGAGSSLSRKSRNSIQQIGDLAAELQAQLAALLNG